MSGTSQRAWSIIGTGDFDGDGMSDIVWRDTLGNTSIWLMNGAAVASAGGLGNVPTTWSIVLTGDYDGDGKSDLLWRDTGGNTRDLVHERRVHIVRGRHRQRTDRLGAVGGAIGQRRVRAVRRGRRRSSAPLR